MTDEITIRNIDVALTKINIQPGDVLVITSDTRLNEQAHLNIRKEINASFGCPVLLLDSGIKLDAVLSISQECLHLAAEERARQAGELADNIRKFAGQVRERS